MKRRIIAMLLILTVAMSMPTMTFAAETEDSAALVMEAVHDETGVTVDVSAEGCDGVTNGRFIVSYDADVLTLVDVQTSGAYAMSSVNDETEGQVALAWIGSELTPEKTLMLTLKFEMNAQNQQDTVITVESDGVYAGMELVSAAGGSVTVSAEYGTVVDTSALEAAVAKAEALNKSNYTPGSYAAVEEALAAAKAVLSDSDATQAEVDDAAKALNDAMSALVLADGSNPDSGDHSMVDTFAGIALVSAMALAALVVCVKRREMV